MHGRKLAIVHDLERDEVLQPACSHALARELKLLLRQRDAVHAAAHCLGEADGEAAPPEA